VNGFRGRPLRAALPIGLVCVLAVAFLLRDSRAGEARELDVTATAYNSVADQTNAEPTLTAWGDRLRPGMKSIAVSRDLIDEGLTHGVEVEISSLPGRWTVRDKMAKRWRRKIDIYMGEDVAAARQWGRRPVTIRWTPSE
jgi:3D (Asp-Asp-Asp) domain-containing protein